ncbi:MAG: Cna domain protein [Phycisphaerales bacterium]|nr:Cna domain protein [Phycisphaerales bacterium]
MKVCLVSATGSAVPPSQGSISGVVFNDNDRDGFFDANEQTSGVRTVFIDTNGNGKLDAGDKSTKSDAKGHYSFTGLSAGTYRLTRVFPSGYTMFPKNPLTINLTSGQALTNVNLGSSLDI